MRIVQKIIKLLIPEKTELEAVETWAVRWYSRNGQYSGDTQQEINVFTNEEDARIFANALKDAYKLLKHSSGTSVTIEKN